MLLSAGRAGLFLFAAAKMQIVHFKPSFKPRTVQGLVRADLAVAPGVSPATIAQQVICSDSQPYSFVLL